MNESKKPDKAFSHLGLPPMELSESKRTGRRKINTLQKLFISVIKGVFSLLLLMLFAIGTCIIVFRMLQTEVTSNTEIILVSESDSENVTLLKGNAEILLHLQNQTSQIATRRKRRGIDVMYNNRTTETIDKKPEHVTSNLKKDIDYKKARQIILEHDVICHDENRNEICRDLVKKLKSITDTDESQTNRKLNNENILNDLKIKDNLNNRFTPISVSKRETRPEIPVDNVLRSTPPMHVETRENKPYMYSNPVNVLPVPSTPTQPNPTSKLTDTCLLARLLKQNYHNSQGLPPNFASEYLSPHYDHIPSYDRYNSQEHDIEARIRKIHPQDEQIFKSFLEAAKTSIETKNQSTSTELREVQCPFNAIPCADGGGCIDEKQWCDGNVDCTDVSDEIQCSCKQRVDKSRLCDGYFDCPFGEDEMGCHGCAENTFSCENFDINLKTTCFTKEQRCNNIFDCLNRKDEFDCNMLAPSIHQNALFAVSSTEGFLQRNFKGDWYVVCKNAYMWAHDACRRETGLVIRPPFMHKVQIDPSLKVNYISTDALNVMNTSETCFNDSAVYVTCPDLLCGTRVLSTSQLIKQDSPLQNDLYGRNKRYLTKSYTHPITFGRRRKRHALNFIRNDNNKSYRLDYFGMRRKERVANTNEMRRKRAEIRVVGGKVSQPAAWPWMLALYRDGMFHCGGVVLSQNWVVSAAHCVHKYWEHYFEVQVGMLRRFSFSPQQHNHRVTHIIVNHKYDRSDMKNDISLLRVYPVIQFSRWVRPICLPGPETAGLDWMTGPAPGAVCTAVGWGATVEHGPEPDHMREVEVPIWSKCKHTEDRAGKEICAGYREGGKDACQGDSGGPLLCRNPLNPQQWYMAGIVSHGDGCGQKDEPGVYTRVSLFVKWIKHHLASKALPAIQPMQECPGFKCLSGVIKCLPKKRICDQIIDCLGGEDEMNCDFMTSTRNLEDDLFLRASKDVIRENHIVESNDKPDSLINNVNSTFNYQYLKNETTAIDSNINLESNVIKIHLNDNKTFRESDNIDFTRASTIEVNSNTSEDNSDYDTVTDETISDKIHTEPADESVTTSTTTLNTRFSNNAKENNEPNEIQAIDTNLNLNLDIERKSTVATNVFEKTELVTQSSNNVENSTPLILVFNINTQTTKPVHNHPHNKDSSELIIELLPTMNSSLLNDLNLNNENINNVTQSKVNTLINTPKPKNNSTRLTLLDGGRNVTRAHDLVRLSAILPALKRRRHRTPKEFQCRRIFQMIPYYLRCNHKPDCEDGTDELDCNCVEYLTTFDEKLLCDGHFDCADGQDEKDCFGCPEDHFLCRQSEMCLQSKYICDGKRECPQGEDELDCYALSNGKKMEFDLNNKPKVNLEGYRTKRHGNDWHIVCEDNLSMEQQEQEATHICRYLGFSSANRYIVKYVNIKQNETLLSDLNNKRRKREISKIVPIHFTYRAANENDNETEVIIKEPQVLKEQCVPNITKICMSLYVFCEHSLFTDFEISTDLLFSRAAEADYSPVNEKWPWIAKIYAEGNYKCTGILIDLSWVLVSHSCLWDTLINKQYVVAVLGSHRTLRSTNSLYEQTYWVIAKTELYHNKVTLLYLRKPANYSTMVKPMVIPSSYNKEDNTTCVAIGQDENNSTITVYLKETNEDCESHTKCFVRQQNGNKTICPVGMNSHQQWAGIISCHSAHGWYPAASFVEPRGECGVGERILAHEISDLKTQMKQHIGKALSNSTEPNDLCEGERCGRGECIKLRQVCDGVKHCEDATDESEQACNKKNKICTLDSYHSGCDCTVGQLKCRNGRCIAKELFKNGQNDCGDGTDEPGVTSCSDYLARVIPTRLCDGILHCHDRSDEDPVFCKCFAKRIFKCGGSGADIDHCVAPDMVCDGVYDCPNGDDERSCIGLSGPEGTPYGKGAVMVRSHGVWYPKCYNTQNHTKLELEAVCRELGFISGHAKQLEVPKISLFHPQTTIALDDFKDVKLNNNTTIKLRNVDKPLATTVVDNKLKNCYPLYIECL